MTHQWQVETPKGCCGVTGRQLAEGEPFYTVLFEEGESFRRVDFSVEAWQGTPPGSFCSFKTRVPPKERRKKVFVEDEILVQFFQRLAEETEPARLQFRFVLALILMRKRLLRYEGSVADQSQEVWTLTLLRDRTAHQVINPRLTEEQIEGVSRQLGTILHNDMGTWTDLEPVSQPAAGAS